MSKESGIWDKALDSVKKMREDSDGSVQSAEAAFAFVALDLQIPVDQVRKDLEELKIA